MQKQLRGTLDLNNSNISSLTGIGAFKNISILKCDNNNLTSLDLGTNDSISEIRVGNNNLTNLDVTGCANLTWLSVYSNSLTTLDITSNPSLVFLGIPNNNFTSIDLSNNTLIEFLVLYGNAFNTLDLSSNLLLKELSFNNNSGTLNYLDLSIFPQLTFMWLDNNNLEYLNVKNGNNTNVTTFNITGNSLECVIVDDPTYSTTNWTNIDAGVNFNLDCAISIPDANFEQKLINLGIDTDNTINQSILIYDAENVTDTLDISNSSIADLTGIEGFINITHLDVSQNNLDTLDLSANTLLTHLDASNNNLDSIQIGNLTNLVELIAIDNNLNRIDISNNTNLVTVKIYNNNFTNLDFANNPLIEKLHIGGNNLNSLLSINALSNLEHFYMNNNTGNLSELYLTSNSLLTIIEISNSGLSYLNLKNGNNVSITDFDARTNSISCILVDDPIYSTANWVNIDASSEFSLNCLVNIPDGNFEQQLINLGIDTDNTVNQLLSYVDAEAVNSLDVSASNIADLTGISYFINLTSLNVNNNSLTALDISSLEYLEILNASNNGLTSIDISNCDDLQKLYLENNMFSTVNISNNNQLTFLNLSSNALDTLDLSSNNLLDTLFVNNNVGQMSVIDALGNSKLLNLQCQNSELNDLKIVKSRRLRTLNASQNNLRELYLNRNDSLEFYNISDNDLRYLITDKQIILKELNCNDNPNIQFLDISLNPKLTALEAQNAGLTSLVATNGNHLNITTFDVTNNNLTCITVDSASYSTANWMNIDIGVSFSQDCGIYIPDTAFEQALIDNNIDKDGVINQTISVANAKSVTGTLSLNAENISNLTGIEGFYNVKKLYLDDNNISQLNVGALPFLEYLTVKNNVLTSLDISGAPRVEDLYVSHNQLTVLDLEFNLKLVELECNNNQLTQLDCSNTKMGTLICHDNQLTYINLKGTYLSDYYQDDNDSYVRLHDHHLDANNNPNLKCILIDKIILPTRMGDNYQREQAHKEILDLPAQVTTDSTVITVPNLGFEQWLNARYSVETDDVVSSTNGYIFKGSAEALTGIVSLEDDYGTIDNLKGIEAFTNITTLNAADFSLTTVNMGVNPTIENIKVSSNDLVSVDVSQCSNLKTLQVQNNELPSIDVSNNATLEHLALWNNPSLKTLDLSNNGSLIKLWARNNNGLEVIKMANGNNANVTYFGALNAPNLKCIEVDDENAAYLSTWTKDNTAAYSTNCDVYFPVQLNAKILLSGAFDSNAELMNDDLRTILPLIEPYSDLGFNFQNNVPDTLPNNDVFLITGNDAIVDWIFVELCDKTDNTIIIETRSALLQADGDIVDTDGISPLSFTSMGDNYFVAFHHRNHLPIMTNTAIELNYEALPFDFSTSFASVVGVNNAVEDLGNGKFGLISGDYNGDGQIQNTDATSIYPFLGTSGYYSSDLDMNGQVQNSDIQNKLLPFLGKGKQF